MNCPSQTSALPQNSLTAPTSQLSHLRTTRHLHFFMFFLQITSDPMVTEEEDKCLGNLLSSSHCTLVALSTLLVTPCTHCVLVTPCSTRLANERRQSLIFTESLIQQVALSQRDI